MVLIQLYAEVTSLWVVPGLGPIRRRRDMDAMLAALVDEDPVREEVAGKTYRGRDAVAGRYRARFGMRFPISP